MTRRATSACDEIAKLARVAESESVRLKALQAIVCHLVAVSKVPNLERRVAKVQEGVFDQTNEADAPGPHTGTTRPMHSTLVS
jgi:hypothetical protein